VWRACERGFASAESCNGIDDDCDGEVDELGVIACGVGACRTSVPACAFGAVNVCVPPAPLATSDGCNGIDDDCDGAVDEDCSVCLHVAPDGDDSAAVSSNGSASFRSIQAAVDFAAAHREIATRVCVAAGPGCGASASYAGPSGADLTMRSGIDVLANYESTTFTRCANSTTQLLPQTGVGVLFPATVVDATVLDGFTLERFASDTSAAVTVDGAHGVTLSNLVIAGGASVTKAYGVNVIDGGDALLFRAAVDAGTGTNEVVGVRSVGSRVRIEDSCSGPVDPVSGRCDATCSGAGPKISVTGNTPQFSSGPALVAAIFLESSPGSSVERSTVCTTYTNFDCFARLGTGIGVHGDAHGVVVRGNSVWGEAATSFSCAGGELSAISLSDCSDAEPWISDNAHLTVEPNPGKELRAVAVEASGDCRPVFDSNLHVSAEPSMLYPNSGPIALRCGALNGVASRCVVAGNLDVRSAIHGVGGIASPSNVAFSATGVACDPGACARISNNTIVGGTLDGSGSFSTSTSLTLTGLDISAPALVRDNSITGVGLAAFCRVFASGVNASGGARLENNRILGVVGGGSCPLVPGGTEKGLWAKGECDTNSNFIAATLGDCTRFELTSATGIPPVDLAIFASGGDFRNNLFGGDCPFSVYEQSALADPKSFENNSLTAAYEDEALTRLAPADVNVLGDMVAGGNIGACAFTSDFHLAPGSACIDAGTRDGSPVDDFDGDARDATPDIGPDEHRP
jgi:hypothetical protein